MTWGNMSLENRLNKLEGQITDGDDPPWILCIYDGKKVSSKEVEAAKEKYMAANPGWRKNAFNVVYVSWSDSS